MPNHEENYVSVIGTPDSIRRFVAEALSDYPTQGEDDPLGDRPAKVLDFERILPMPAELRNTVSPHEVVATQEEADKRNAEYNEGPMSRMHRSEDEPIQIRFMTAAEVQRRAETYGALDWYSWALENWGTKWGAYNPSHYELRWLRNHEGEVYGRVDLHFQTAWSQPTPIFELIEKRFGVAVYAVTQDEGGFPDVEYGDPYEHEVIRKVTTFEFECWDDTVDEPAEVHDAAE